MKLNLRAYKMVEAPTDSTPLGVIDMGVGGKPPFPPETAEVSSLDDVFAALNDYAERAGQAGKPMVVSASKGGGRSVRGFNQLHDHDLSVPLNADKL